MLYRLPRPAAARIIAAIAGWIAGIGADLRRTSADEAYLDGLNENALRDLGIQRIVTRDDSFYR